jgi:hypothetical protein
MSKIDCKDKFQYIQPEYLRLFYGFHLIDNPIAAYRGWLLFVNEERKIMQKKAIKREIGDIIIRIKADFQKG